MGDGPRSSSSILLARGLSAAGHPLVLIPLTIAVATRSLRWALLVAGTTVIPLALVIAINVRRGRWSDFDVSRQDQRSGLYYAGLPALLLAAVVLHFTGASARMMRGLLAGAAMMAAGLLGNRLLKISMHMMFAAFCAVVLADVDLRSLAVTVPFALALAWARRTLNRHTWAEIAAGTAIGVAAGVFANWPVAAI